MKWCMIQNEYLVFAKERITFADKKWFRDLETEASL
jgi:hypothetical protein